MNEARRFLKRQAAQKEIVDQAEDGGAETNPERESQDREQSEAGRFAQLPEGEAKVGHHEDLMLGMSWGLSLDSRIHSSIQK